MASHRLFFALVPPEPVRARLQEAAQFVRAHAGESGRATLATQLHVTLAFLGDFKDDDDVVARALAAGARTTFAPFALEIDQAASFGPTWFLGCSATPPALRALHAALAEELAREGFALERRAFHPHVTFQRKAAGPLASTPIAPIHWPVLDFVLYDSRPAERRYFELARWPTGASAPVGSQ